MNCQYVYHLQLPKPGKIISLNRWKTGEKTNWYIYKMECISQQYKCNKLLIHVISWMTIKRAIYWATEASHRNFICVISIIWHCWSQNYSHGEKQLPGVLLRKDVTIKSWGIFWSWWNHSVFCGGNNMNLYIYFKSIESISIKVYFINIVTYNKILNPRLIMYIEELPKNFTRQYRLNFVKRCIIISIAPNYPDKNAGYLD